MTRYLDHLKSEYWASLKRDALDRYGSQCQGQPDGVDCQTTEHLDLHHVTYARVGHERLADVVLLCRPCHVRRHSGERFTLRYGTGWTQDARTRHARQDTEATA